MHLRVASLSTVNSNSTWVAFETACLARGQVSVFLACRICLQSCRLCHLKAAVPSYSPSEKEVFHSITSTGKCLTMRKPYLCSVSRRGLPKCITLTCESLIRYLPAVEMLSNKKYWLQPHYSIMYVRMQCFSGMDTRHTCLQ